jgi:hypothetical protein
VFQQRSHAQPTSSFCRRLSVRARVAPSVPTSGRRPRLSPAVMRSAAWELLARTCDCLLFRQITARRRSFGEEVRRLLILAIDLEQYSEHARGSANCLNPGIGLPRGCWGELENAHVEMRNRQRLVQVNTSWADRTLLSGLRPTDFASSLKVLTPQRVVHAIARPPQM